MFDKFLNMVNKTDKLTYSKKNKVQSTSLVNNNNLNYCPKCGQILNNSIVCPDCSNFEDYSIDKVFEDLDSDILIYLQMTKSLSKYVELKNKLSTNDTLWAIYNLNKSKCEQNNDLSNLDLTLSKMFNQLYCEKKFNQALKFMYCSFYCQLYYRISITTCSFSKTNALKLKRALRAANEEFSKDNFKVSIMELIPTFYNEKTMLKIYKIMLNGLDAINSID